MTAGDPNYEVTIARHAYQQLRSIYQARDPADGRKPAEHVIDTFHTCPIPEVAHLGRTLRQWISHVLARLDTDRIPNGGTEAINLIIEKSRRLATIPAPSTTSDSKSCSPPQANATTGPPRPMRTSEEPH